MKRNTDFITWIDKNRELLENILEDENFRNSFIKDCMIQNFNTKKFCNFSKFNPDNRVCTNKEFPNFFQSIFHAATKEQFYYYAKIDNQLVNNTFNYLFDAFKKGIYVKIENKVIKVFLPFSNTNYINDWGQNIRTKTGISPVEFQEKFHRDYSPMKYQVDIQQNVNKWYANYCIFRNTVYKRGILRGLDDEGDKSVANFLLLITNVCFNKNVPDVEFFISPRDFPIIRKDLLHPYDRLYPKGKIPSLKKYGTNTKIVPIFSQSITKDYSDELIPNDDDIINILENPTVDYYSEWESKKPIAIFRGSATGCGTTSTDNTRLKLVEISKKNKHLMSAMLTGLNAKPKVNKNGFLEIIDKRKYSGNMRDNFMSSEEQSGYKYIIHVDGHVSAFRLSKEFSYNSLILKVDSEWKVWYSDKLIGANINDNQLDDAHYIRIKSDLSNITDVINWCKKNDSICKKIASNGYNFWKEHFSNQDYIIDYTYNKLVYYSEIQN